MVCERYDGKIMTKTMLPGILFFKYSRLQYNLSIAEVLKVTSRFHTLTLRKFVFTKFKGLRLQWFLYLSSNVCHSTISFLRVLNNYNNLSLVEYQSFIK